MNVLKESEVSSSECVKCLSIKKQEIILNVVLFKSNNKYLKLLMKNKLSSPM